MNFPLKIYLNPHSISYLPHPQYLVLKLHPQLDLQKRVDEFANSELINTQDILERIFQVDGRLLKHYRLLQWFPKYMKLFYES